MDPSLVVAYPSWLYLSFSLKLILTNSLDHFNAGRQLCFQCLLEIYPVSNAHNLTYSSKQFLIIVIMIMI